MFILLDLADDIDGPAEGGCNDCAFCAGFLPALALEPPAECPTKFFDPEGLPWAIMIAYIKCTGDGTEETDEIDKKTTVDNAFSDCGNDLLN